MNVFKMVKIMSILAVCHMLHSMERNQNGLSEIEKQLVLREVAKRGKDAVEKEILQELDDIKMRYDEEDDQVRFRISPKLEIKETFSQNQVATDPFVKIVFERITKIEKESGYFPDNDTNFLGSNTRYYWVKKDKKKQESGVVEVKSYFKQREPLLEIIKNNKG